MSRRACSLGVLFGLLLAQLAGHVGCGHSGLRADEDDDYYGDDEEKTDEDSDRPRKRRRRPRRGGRSNAPVLLQLRRLPDAVVENSTSGRATEDVAELRSSLCDGREDQPVIFYQLIVANHWHYYWICSDSLAQRAATSQGNDLLMSWVQRLSRRAEVDSAGCTPGSRRRLFKQTHESGTRAKVYCDGRIVLRFADGGKKTRPFTTAAGTAGAGTVTTNPPVPSPDGRSVCPACPACPTVRTSRVDCQPPRPCPPPRACPQCPVCQACDCKEKMRTAGEKGFWQGVAKACQRICTLVYKKCRTINPNTALCYQVSEYCAETCAKK